MKTIVIKKKYNPFIESNEHRLVVSDEIYDLFEQEHTDNEKHRKRLQTKLKYVDTFDGVCDRFESEPCPIEESVKREEAQNIRRALMELSNVQRRRVIARFVKEKTFEQIAEAEKVAVVSIQESISAALDKLRIICQEQKDA